MPPLSLQVSAKAFRAGGISRQSIQLAKIPKALLIAKISMKRDCKLLFPTRPNRYVQIVRITAAVPHQANLPQAGWARDAMPFYRQGSQPNQLALIVWGWIVKRQYQQLTRCTKRSPP